MSTEESIETNLDIELNKDNLIKNTIETTELKNDLIVNTNEPTELKNDLIVNTNETTELKNDSIVNTNEPTELKNDLIVNTNETTELKNDSIVNTINQSEENTNIDDKLDVLLNDKHLVDSKDDTKIDDDLINKNDKKINDNDIKIDDIKNDNEVNLLNNSLTDKINNQIITENNKVDNLNVPNILNDKTDDIQINKSENLLNDDNLSITANDNSKTNESTDDSQSTNIENNLKETINETQLTENLTKNDIKSTDNVQIETKSTNDNNTQLTDNTQIETQSTINNLQLTNDLIDNQKSNEQEIKNNEQNLLLSINNQQNELNDQQNQIATLQNDNQQEFIFQDNSNQTINQQQQQLIFQQTQNPETGEVLLVLQGENGEQIAIPPEAIQNGFVQIRDSEGNEQIIALALPNEDGTLSSNLLTNDQLQTNDQSINNNLNEQIFLQQLDVSADILNNLGAASIAIPTQQLTPTTASTNVVQSIETPRVSISTQETAISGGEIIQQHSKILDNITTTSSSTDLTNQQSQQQQQMTNIEKNILDDNKKLDSNEQSSIDNNLTLENIIVSNATSTLLPTDQLNQTEQNNFVFMTTDDNQLATMSNLSSELTNGQTFLIQTPDGQVTFCSAQPGENGTIQFVQSNELTNQNQYIIQQANDQQQISSAIQDNNQVVEAVNDDNGQQITIAISNNSNELELLPVNNQTPQASLIDLKNNLQSNKSTIKTPTKSSSKSSINQTNNKHSNNNSNASNIILVSSDNASPNIKTVQNPVTASTKKQNISIIQNINHLQLNQNQTPSQSSTTLNRKKIQSHHQINKPLHNTVTVTPSTLKSTHANLLIVNQEETKKSITINHDMHTPQSVNNKQQNSTATPLSSSRKTYSRKNIVWLNPVQSTSIKQEPKEDKIIQPKIIDSNDKKSVTITPVKENVSSAFIDKNNQQQQRSSPQIRKGTITISTVIDNNKSNRNSNIYNQVKIVPSETQSRLFKNNNNNNNNSNQTAQPESTNNLQLKNSIELKSIENDDKMEIDICLPATDNNNANNKRVNTEPNEEKEEICLDDKPPTKRLKRNSFTVTEESKKEIKNNEKLKMNNDEVIASINIKSESGRRKSPIKPLTDCETNFDDETKEIKVEDDNSEDLNNYNDDDIKSKKDDNVKSENQTTQQQAKNLSTNNKTSTIKQDSTRTKSKSESENNKKDKDNELDESNNDSFKRRRSCRFSKVTTQAAVENVKNVKGNKSQTEVDKKEEEVDKPSLKIVKNKDKISKQEEKSLDENASKTQLRRGRSRKSESELVANEIKKPKKKIENESVVMNNVESTKQQHQENSQEEESKRVDEDSLRFDLLFNSSKVDKSNELEKSNKTTSAEKERKTRSINKEKDNKLAVLNLRPINFEYDDMDIDLTDNSTKTNKRTTRSRQSSLSNTSMSTIETSIPNKKRYLRSSLPNSKATITIKQTEIVNKQDSGSLSPTKKESIHTDTKQRHTILGSQLNTDKRNDEQFYDLKLNDKCEVHVRYQTPTKNIPKSTSTSNHTCQKCGFKTDRINNLILHYKTDCKVENYYQTELNKYSHKPLSSSETTAALLSPTPSSSTIISKKKRILEDSNLKDSCSDDDLNEDNLLDNKNDFKGFRENEIVWVDLEEQKCKWVALIIKILPFTNQATVVLIDIPDEDRLQITKNLYSIDELISFNDATQNLKFINETKSNYDDKIVKAVQRAETYTRKKLLDEEDIDISKLLGIRNLTETTNNRSTDDKKIEKIKIDNLNLLKFIKSGKLDSFLCGIYRESIKSERHSSFKIGLKSNYSSNYGPFRNDEEMSEELFNYLKELFKNNFPNVDSEFDFVAYLFDVWYAEAVIKGINRLYRISIEEAENIFKQKQI